MKLNTSITDVNTDVFSLGWLNILHKRERCPDWIRKTTTKCCYKNIRKHFVHRLKLKDEKIYHEKKQNIIY